MIARRLWVPSLPDVFFAVLLISVFAQPAGMRALLADGDTGWHIRTGELVLASGRAPQVDDFSFTRPGAPWFAWEWLADVALARMYGWRGMAGVAILAGSILALAATALLLRVLRRGCGLWIGLAATLAAASASSVHYLARPHVFTILFFAVALWLVEEDRNSAGGRPWRLEEDRKSAGSRPWRLEEDRQSVGGRPWLSEEDRRNAGSRLWLLVPLTALWANLHAGFVAWLATLGLLTLVCASQRDWARVRRYGALTGMCAAATLLNPYGWRLHQHVAGYLNSRWILDNVQEFQSPNIRSEGMVVFAVLLLAAVAVTARGDRFEAALVLVWGFASLRSARHVPLFAIAAAPVVASSAAALWERIAAQARPRDAVRILWEMGRDLARAPRASLWVPVSAAAVMLAAPTASFPDVRFPVDAVERNAECLAPKSAMPRILTSDQWADYLIFRLYPRQRVFFDGRSDFFGPALGADYRKLMTGERPWRELLDRYGFQLALLPHDWPLSTALEREPGWRRVYEDRVAVLFARGEGTP